MEGKCGLLGIGTFGYVELSLLCQLVVLKRLEAPKLTDLGPHPCSSDRLRVWRVPLRCLPVHWSESDQHSLVRIGAADAAYLVEWRFGYLCVMT